MKTIKLFALALITLYGSGCTDELFDLKFDLPTVEVQYIMKAKAEAGEFILADEIVKLNIDSIASANGTNLSKFKSVEPEKITIEIVSPATANFDILDSGTISITTGTLAGGDLKTEVLASFKNIPKGITKFDIIPTKIELLDYAKKKEFKISGKLNTNGPLLEDVKLKFTLFAKVIANPIP